MIRTIVAAMAPMHDYVYHGTQQQNQVWQCINKVRFVFRQQEIEHAAK